MPGTDPRAPASPEPAAVSVVGPDGGESIQLGPTLMRILEDGSTTGRRLGVGEITLAPHTASSTPSPLICTSGTSATCVI
jgi:hypothetical protein